MGRLRQSAQNQKIVPISLRGPAPASQPEIRALMGLLERSDGKVVTLCDFHENVGVPHFLHQHAGRKP